MSRAEGMQGAGILCAEFAAQGLAVGPYGLPQQLGVLQADPDMFFARQLLRDTFTGR